MGLLKAQPCDVWCFWYTMRDTRFEDTVKSDVMKLLDTRQFKIDVRENN